MRGADSEGTGVLCGEGGFTLIETILTLSILVILLGLVLSSLRIGVMSWERGRDGRSRGRFEKVHRQEIFD